MLPAADPAALGIDPGRLERLYGAIQAHIAENRYPGAQVALARHGKLVAFRTFGQARLGQPAAPDTLWLLYSQTKVITAAAVWVLVDQGAVNFNDRISDHIPEFARHGKKEITLFQVLTHQAGFPDAHVPPRAWEDHELLRRAVCDFTLDWTPGSKVRYHLLAAHWVCAVLIEALTGRDYRDFIRSALLEPLGLTDLYVGVPPAVQHRCADMHVVRDGRFVPLREQHHDPNSPEWRAAGVPGGGGYGTAAAMVAFYQMLLNGGVLNGVRVLSPRTIAFVTRNHTGDRVDEFFGMPMHRGLGPHLRGLSPNIRGLGELASPAAFGHGGMGSSYSWADPETGLAFSYLTNCIAEEPWHSRRMLQISNLAHAAVVEP